MLLLCIRCILPPMQVPMRQGEPHLVTSDDTHCMYGFTDGEHKKGHVR